MRGPKFRAFFPSHKFCSFFSLWGSSRGIVAAAHRMCAFGVLYAHLVQSLPAQRRTIEICGGRREKQTKFRARTFDAPTFDPFIFVAAFCVLLSKGSDLFRPLQLWAKPGEAQGGGPKCWGPKVGGPKMSRFFNLSRHNFQQFFSLLGVFSWNFGGVWGAGTLKCARMEFPGCRVKPRRPQSASQTPTQTARLGFPGVSPGGLQAPGSPLWVFRSLPF